MDPARQESLRPIVRALKKSRRPGMIYVVPEHKRLSAGWRVPWPRDREARLDKLAELIEILEKLAVSAFVLWVEDGQAVKHGQQWPWGEACDLFSWLPGQTQDPYPHWAFRDGGEDEVSQPAAKAKPAPPDPKRGVVIGLIAEAKDVGPLVTGAEMEPPAKPPRYHERCASAALELLEEAGRRLTLDEFAVEMERLGVCSRTSASHTLPEMRRRGLVDNAPMPGDSHGVGYGLPKWKQSDD